MEFSELFHEADIHVRYCMIGPLETNVFIVTDEKASLVVDPAGECEKIVAELTSIGKPLEAIILTHGHSDHVGAAAELREQTGAPVYAFEREVPLIEGSEPPINRWPKQVPCTVDKPLSDGEEVLIGQTSWRVIHTPGHSLGSMCLYAEGKTLQDSEERSKPILIAGDTLFFGTIGRTDLRGGSMDDMRASLKTLSQLPDETLVLTGHGSMVTIAYERKSVFSYFC